MNGKQRTQLITFFSVLLLLLVLEGGCAGKKATIRSIAPKSGLAGIRLTISGNNFGVTQGKATVKMGRATYKVSSWSDTSISAFVPGSLSAGKYAVSVITAAGTSNLVSFSVIKEITASSPLEAMSNYLKKKGVNTAGVTFSVASASKIDPNWKLDKGSKAGKQPSYFILHHVNGGWTVVDYGTGFTAARANADGAPSDLALP